jgi:hypothetical protein
MDFSKQLDALREVSGLLTKKEDVPDELWAASGMAPKTRLKDVNNQIVVLKKQVSRQTKEVVKAQEAELDEEEGVEKKPVAVKVKGKGSSRQEGSDKKMQGVQAHQGRFDMACDRVWDDGEALHTTGDY